MVAQRPESWRDDDTLLRRLPPIRRARDYHLYDHSGRRYLDLWLGGGRALLGHRPENVLTEVKNQLSKGLLGDFPSIYERRLFKALAKVMPGYTEFRVYRSMERLYRAVAPLVGDEGPSDPALGSFGRPAFSLWRPFLPESGATRARNDGPGSSEASSRAGSPAMQVAVPVLPLFATGAPEVAAFSEPPGDTAGPSDVVSPALLSGITKAVIRLVRFGEQYTEDLWRRFDAPFWRRTGPYLAASCAPEEYPALFDGLLSRGVLISPYYRSPSVVPASATDGEIKPLRDFVREQSGE